MASNPEYHSPIHPALTSFVDECCATLARLIAYVGALALFGILSVHLWDQFQPAEAAEPASKAGFALASRSRPAFAVGWFDPYEKSDTYAIFRHPEGGRKDVFHWVATDGKPVAELEIYRPGSEFDPRRALPANIAARMEVEDSRDLEPAGMIDSKFGAFTLLRVRGSQDDARSCLGFFRRFDDPLFQISGWSCQGTTWPARRAAIRCMLNRLTLLASGNDPKFAELFARAELNRTSCAAATAISADWVTGIENPRLRGPL
jgi:hypothetical protein